MSIKILAFASPVYWKDMIEAEKVVQRIKTILITDAEILLINSEESVH